MAVEERSVEVGGASIRYLAAGEGSPLVLLHGVGTSALEWNRAIPALAHGRSVYALHLLEPESGDRAGYSPASFAGFVAKFLDALEIERATVVGNSLGGLVALRLALSNPSRVDALGLVDSAGLGWEITPALSLATLPGYGEAAIYWAKNLWALRSGPGGGRRCSSPFPARRPRSGWRSSTGWAWRPASCRQRWPPCAAT